jgi:aryl-alcohol dehydrogenase-like predicted oxidoreductase
MSNSPMLDKREQAIATIHRALDLGITLFDTSNIYAPTWDAIGHNEALIAEAMRTYSGPADLGRVLVTTKGGITRGPGETWGRDSRPDALLAACEASLVALDVDRIELYQHHRHDPTMTYRDQMLAVGGLRRAGLIRMIGLSNVTVDELRVALSEFGGPDDGGVVSVQNEFSPRHREGGDVLELCTDRGIAFLPWSPLGGADQAHDVGSRYADFAEVGRGIDATAQQVVLAWLLAMSPVMIPIPGATRPTTVDSIVGSAGLALSSAELDLLMATVPEASSMYPDDLPRSPLS